MSEVLHRKVCPDCDSDSMYRAMQSQTFGYGVRGGAVDLTVTVPVWTCAICGCQLTDMEAEDIRSEAVRQHLARRALAKDPMLAKIARNEAKLKTCPFCGGKGRLLPQKDGWLVLCHECSARMPVTTRHIRQAVVEWNHRRG